MIFELETELLKIKIKFESTVVQLFTEVKFRQNKYEHNIIIMTSVYVVLNADL